MHKILTATVIGATFLLASCGSGSKEPQTLEEKKSRLDVLKKQQETTNKDIDTLEAQISRMDTTSTLGKKAKLVALTNVAPVSFTHYIDLQGSVEAENTSWVSPRGQGGVVRQVFVKQGDHVNKGQLLMKLDDVVQRTSLSKDQIQLDHAKDIYQRRKNLWDEKIGTEVELINARNDVNQAESQLKLDQDQLDFTNVYADITGTINTLSIKVGEMFAVSAGSQGAPGIQIINTDNLKVTVQVPEIYQERVKVGTPVHIAFPGLNNKQVTGVVHISGKVIDQGNRSFQVEIHLPNSSDIRANQVAVVKLQDYTAQNVLSIPVNTLQTDEKGKYVIVAVKNKDNALLAHKKSVTIGQTYEDKVEITGGLEQGDQLVTDGFQGLYEGQLLTIQ